MEVENNLLGQLPLGMSSFRLQLEEPGRKATAILYFSNPMPANIVWYKYDAINSWVDYRDHPTIRADRKSGVLESQDGGNGDADGVGQWHHRRPIGPGHIPTFRSRACLLDTLF
jgi:hypothetical protein